MTVVLTRDLGVEIDGILYVVVGYLYGDVVGDGEELDELDSMYFLILKDNRIVKVPANEQDVFRLVESLDSQSQEELNREESKEGERNNERKIDGKDSSQVSGE